MSTLRITFSRNPAKQPLRGEYNLRKPNPKDDIYILDWTLTDGCVTTDKFISLMQETFRLGEMRQSPEHDCNGIRINYNLYPSISPDEFRLMKERLNSVVKKCGEIEGVPKADASLELDTSTTDLELDKLNALHLYFEDVSNDTSVNLREDYLDGDIQTYLEEINQLVHTMEDWREQDWDEYFGSVRLAPRHGETSEELTMPLQKEDYARFTTEAYFGDLMLDYFRIGKDLDACRLTNDTKLVQTRGLAQQNTVHTCFSFLFHKYLTGFTWQWKGIDEWIEENNLGEYYDYTAPEFTKGRVCLGKLNMRGKTIEQLMPEVMKITCIINVEII